MIDFREQVSRLLWTNSQFENVGCECDIDADNLWWVYNRKLPLFGRRAQAK
jgi:hypothetical protein